MIKKTVRKLLAKILQSRGYSPYFADLAVKLRYDDLIKNKNTTLKQKIWAHKRGFLSNKVVMYGLTDENYRDYLPDFDYYRLHPINGAFSKWIDDKLTMKYILQPYSEYLPEYYFQIKGNEILRLTDCPVGNEGSIPSIINLLKEKHILAAKLISGSYGEGFYKLAYIDHRFYQNNKLSSENEIELLLKEWLQKKFGGYLITEYVSTNSILGTIWGETPNRLRITIVRERNQPPKMVSSTLHFGTNKTGVIDHVTSGGVTCPVNIETGVFTHGYILENSKVIQYQVHPDTRVLLEGVVPFWSLVREKIIEISSYIPQLIYMAYDLAVTEDGFKIFEINSHQGLGTYQFFRPIYRNELLKDFFLELVREKNRR